MLVRWPWSMRSLACATWVAGVRVVRHRGSSPRRCCWWTARRGRIAICQGGDLDCRGLLEGLDSSSSFEHLMSAPPIAATTFSHRRWCLTAKSRRSGVFLVLGLGLVVCVGIAPLTRVNSTNILDEGLKIGGRATTRDSGIEIGTRCTQVHVPALEDRYILLAI
jgi:hypothetical protein